MITELTKEQKDKMPLYAEKWIKIGTNTDRLDYDNTVDIVHDVQQHILNQDKTPVIIFDNPLEAWVACNYAANGFTVNQLKKCVDDYFSGKKPDFEIQSFVEPYFVGSFFASVFSFYDFFKYELGLKYENDEKYEIWKKTTQLGYMYNIKDVQGSVQDMMIVSQKPSKVMLSNRVIHCDGGSAVEYAGHGDVKVFALNGVTVPEWLATTHHSKIDVQKINEITNADIKAEFIKKVGIERLLSLGVKVDGYENYPTEKMWQKSQYELYDMNKLFTGIPFAPHLKMLNQTTGIWHVEAVSPECTNLRKAIQERLGGLDLDIVSIA